MNSTDICELTEMVNNMKKVSIVIPIYNQEAYLHRSLESVLRQTYSELEIICVNDGSTDSSISILEHYERDKRVTIISQENGGLIHAIVQGVKKSTGEYLCFLDPDDYLSESFIQRALSEIGDHDFVAFGHYFDDGHVISVNKVDADNPIIFDRDGLECLKHNLIWDIKQCKLSKSVLNSRWNKMYKTAVVKKFIDRYDGFRQVSFGEDTFFTYLLLSSCTSGITIPGANGYYYNTGNQLSMMSNSKIANHLQKSHLAFENFKALLLSDYEDSFQAYALYYFLIESLFQRLEHGESEEEFHQLYSALHCDIDYLEALNGLIKKSTGKRKLVFFLRRFIKNPRLYLKVYKLAYNKVQQK